VYGIAFELLVRFFSTERVPRENGPRHSTPWIYLCRGHPSTIATGLQFISISPNDAPAKKLFCSIFRPVSVSSVNDEGHEVTLLETVFKLRGLEAD